MTPPLPPRATLVLYTDGLIERRGRSLDESFDALAEAVLRHAGSGVEQLADGVLDSLRSDDTAPDDTVLLVARSAGTSG